MDPITLWITIIFCIIGLGLVLFPETLFFPDLLPLSAVGATELLPV